jgi:hypothetical protein
MQPLNDAEEGKKREIPGAGGERRATKGVQRKELDGLESVPRLLFLWNRRPRIAAANPRHHGGRYRAVATMALAGHLSGTRVLVLPVFRKKFDYIQIPQGNDSSGPGERPSLCCGR